jgi:hypothetical protein
MSHHHEDNLGALLFSAKAACARTYVLYYIDASLELQGRKDAHIHGAVVPWRSWQWPASRNHVHRPCHRRQRSLPVPAKPVNLSASLISVLIPFHMSSMWFMAGAHSSAGATEGRAQRRTDATGWNEERTSRKLNHSPRFLFELGGVFCKKNNAMCPS